MKNITLRSFNTLFHREKKSIDLTTATQWQLIWIKLRQHKLAWLSLWFLFWVYLIAIFAEFFAPFDPSDNWRKYTYAPPQSISFFEKGNDGWSWAPHLNLYTNKVDPRTLKRIYQEDENNRVYFSFFAKTEKYKLLGFIPMSHKLIYPDDPSQPFFILGADRMGRDMLSRLIYGARISLSVGLIGVLTTFILGIFIGGVSGYFGGGWITLFNEVLNL
ncbi:hypothetical protein L0B53_14340 [Vibrio sp. SS-MA-C1-2]|uniref:hypothetical protein n=1 Tax=Vibrio sp. SS-MA-C1-2 TaxID=2908646 RepID=UPI001F341805|nr:hypothetical protein [Vibrio sp. SS-MA-C1-2]UJF18188.1 hypothetical protein L0B53_14340 [Vibrio sp. SS-MA-C1-2]